MEDTKRTFIASSDTFSEYSTKISLYHVSTIDDIIAIFKNELKESVKSKLQNVVSANGDYQLNDKYMTDIKYYLMNISKRNKKLRINFFILL